jgi:hypothetical protein
MRYPDFLRTATLLFAASATALAVVAIAGARAKDDTTLQYVALAWWATAAAAGAWLGRRSTANRATAKLLAGARTTPLLPELQPGTILFNRLWWLLLFTVAAGAVAFVVPQVPAVGAGYAIAFALAWRNHSPAVVAVEERDGVRFYVEHNSPFKPTQLLRTPGFRKNEPSPTDVRAGATP